MPGAALAACVLALAFGCDDPPPETDGGPLTDAGPSADGGPADAGPLVDAGPRVDAGPPDAGPPRPADGLYALSNADTGNEILAFARGADGRLTSSGAHSTGGMGSGGGLGTQNGLVFDASQNRFFAVNRGDDTISMLHLEEDGSLTLESNVASGGVSPVTIHSSGDVVYVANAGDDSNAANISGFRIVGEALEPIADSTRPLSVDGPGPGQLQFVSDGSVLVVTEKGTNRITTFLMEDGIANGPIAHPSVGTTPFGFAETEAGQLVVSEAFGGADGLGASSSYTLGAGSAGLVNISPSVGNHQSAPCWLVVNGLHAYVTNTRSNSVTGYDLDAEGNLTLGWSTPSGAGPIDATMDPSGAFLYVLNAGDDSFSIYAANPDTGLLVAQTAFTGLPPAASGLAAGNAAIYTMSNDGAGNAINGYFRAADGSLSAMAPVMTGGLGSDGGLGSQNALVIDEARTRLFVVNRGDDSISMLSIAAGGAVTLQSNVPSGGVSPISLTVAGDLVYVANAGDDSNPANISGFTIDGDTLTPIADSARPMSADGPGPGQIEFSPDASMLVLSEKGTNRITLYEMDGDAPGGPIAHPSVGRTPFGFAFTAEGHLLVSEAFGGDADAGAASSYDFSMLGTLSAVSESVASGQSAPCWVALAGDYAYVTNTRSNTLSAYLVAADGTLTFEYNATTGEGPIDASVTEDGQFLYVLNNGSDSISVFAIDASTGVLTEVEELLGELPASAVGLVAR